MRLSSEELYSAKEIFESLLLELNGSEKELKNWLFW